MIKEPISQNLNPFSSPHKYRKTMLLHSLVKYNPENYSGKSLTCVFFTRFCGVGCPFCFFKSAPPPGKLSVAGHFSDDGVTNFIRFINQANTGYILVSGGGEPLNHKNAILRTIAEAKADRIVLVTSGSWAMNKKAGRAYLRQIEEAISKRETPCHITVRISVSEGHGIKLGTTPAKNLIEIFEEELRDHPYLKFQIHAFENDSMLYQILEHFDGHQIDSSEDGRASDDPFVLKVIPQKLHVTFQSGYRIIVGISKIFKSGLRPNLNTPDSLQESIVTYERDLIESEDNNSAIVDNADGRKGLDWSINYNGNTCTWQNQVNDNQYNLYEDSYEEILEGSLKDPLMLSYIDKGRLYREEIVAEVSPRSVLRTKGINLRDYSGTVIFEEEKTRLYYAIRAIQDYLEEGRINIDELQKLPDELCHLIYSDKKKTQEAYHNATYTIIDQYLRKEFDPIEWRDLFELIKLGHYDVTEEDIQQALTHYNSQPGVNQIASLEEIKHEIGDIERRLTERLMYIKPMNFDALEDKEAVNE